MQAIVLSGCGMTICGGRKRGILINSENLCAAAQFANARLVGQNDSGAAVAPRMGVKCPKHRKKHRKQRHGKGKSGGSK